MGMAGWVCDTERHGAGMLEPGLGTQLSPVHIPVACSVPRTHCWLFLCLSFLICKMGTVRVATCWGCREA